MYKLTQLAADDFGGIYDYTLNEFGAVQADHYTDALEAFFDMLAEMPELGRNYSAVPNVLRIEFQRHTVFYRVREADIPIVRILHQQMNHTKHFL